MCLLGIFAALALFATCHLAAAKPPVWQLAAVEVTVYKREGCNEEDSVLHKNVTDFGKCFYRNYDSYQVTKSVLEQFDSVQVAFYSGGSCLSSGHTGFVPLNNTCTRLSGGYTAQVKPFFTIAPPTTHSDCIQEGFYLEPGTAPNLMVHRMTTENISINADGQANNWLGQTTYWVTLRDGVCASSPNLTNVFLRIKTEGLITNNDIEYPSRESIVLRATKITVDLVGGQKGSHARSIAEQTAKILNSECLCGVTFSAGTGPITIQPKQCKPPLPDTFWLCWFISGSPFFLEADTLDNAQGTWQHSYLNDSLRHRESSIKLALAPFEQTSNNDQDYCNYDLWNECEPTVAAVVRVCGADTSSPWNDLCVIQIMGQEGLTTCCPCMVRYVSLMHDHGLFI